MIWRGFACEKEFCPRIWTLNCRIQIISMLFISFRDSQKLGFRQVVIQTRVTLIVSDVSFLFRWTTTNTLPNVTSFYLKAPEVLSLPISWSHTLLSFTPSSISMSIFSPFRYFHALQTASSRINVHSFQAPFVNQIGMKLPVPQELCTVNTIIDV
jgi:hypothetical protein